MQSILANKNLYFASVYNLYELRHQVPELLLEKITRDK